MTSPSTENFKHNANAPLNENALYTSPSPFTTEQSGYTFFEAGQGACDFDPDVFDNVMENLIRNPNVTSSHLFRADIFWDSEKDSSFCVSADGRLISSFVQHIKSELRPVELGRVQGFQLTRSLVRQLIPRNTNLDRPLAQTCHFYRCKEQASQYSLVLYVPHVDTVSRIPWYHPPVRSLAFLHCWEEGNKCSEATQAPPKLGNLSIHVSLFESSLNSVQSPKRLDRTLKKLLSTIIKHGTGRLQGYEKHGHHDNVIPQARLQDTYTRLKNKHAKILLRMWAELTDATKGVFEDLGIAAFLIELWRDMYSQDIPFPGFVDVACGNGILVYILVQEGFRGWGFDARQRKTWLSFPNNVQENLKHLVFVPPVFSDELDRQCSSSFAKTHDGIFEDGTFIVSNHADELTMWTPLLAYMNFEAPFLAIPCCSHDFAGAKTRFRANNLGCETKETEAKTLDTSTNNLAPSKKAIDETNTAGQLDKQPSAYSTLCSAITSVTSRVGYTPEVEMLRIPSTRNFAVVGRQKAHPSGDDCANQDFEERTANITRIIEEAMGRTIADVGAEWVERAKKLVDSKGKNH